MGTHQTRHTMSAEGEDGSLNEYLYKVLVVGDIGTGKTSIIKRYVHNIFSMHYKSTIGVDFALKVINWDENSVVRLQLWDIAGQERFGNMTRVSTFEAVQKWKSDIDAKVFLSDNRPIPVVLLANKCDLAGKEGICQDRRQMDKFCEDNGFIGWFETSAKSAQGIEEAAKCLVGKILEQSPVAPKQEKATNKIVLNKEPQPQQKQEDSCC